MTGAGYGASKLGKITAKSVRGVLQERRAAAAARAAEEAEEAAAATAAKLKEDEFAKQRMDNEGGGQPQGMKPAAAEDAQSLYQRAAKAEPGVTKDMGKIADSTGGQQAGLQNRLKSVESLQRKLQDVPADKVADSLRYTVTYDKDAFAGGAQKALDQLRQAGYKVDQIKNTFLPNAEYKGVNVKLISPDGTPVELQFHTPESFAAKETNHALYEQARLLPPGSPQTQALRQQMIQKSSQVAIPPGADKLH